MAGPVFFASDLSPASEPALAMAIDMAKRRACELVIAHVYPSPATSATDDLFMPGLSEEIEAAAREEASSELQPLVERAKRAGVDARGLLLAGIPDQTLVSEAQRAGAELVVIGTHGRKGLRRALLGSVASNIIAEASCPVLTVRPEAIGCVPSD